MALVNEWDPQTFHRQVMELEAKGYVSRRETYHITPEMDPETGKIIHLYSIEMLEPDDNESKDPTDLV